MRLAKVVSLGIVALLVVACGGVKIPSIPPIPSFPTIPSFSLPSGFPTPAPGQSVDPATGVCRLLSAAEVGGVMGATYAVSEGDAESCTYTAVGGFSTINVRTESGDLTAARFLLGDTAQDVNIGGHPGLKGTFVGSPLIYLQNGDTELVFQGVLLSEDTAAALAKIEQIANIGGPRW